MTREYTFTTSRTSALDWEMRRGRRIRSSAPSRPSKALWQPSHLVLMKKGVTAPLVFSSATMEFQVSVHTSDLGVRPRYGSPPLDQFRLFRTVEKELWSPLPHRLAGKE